MSHAPSSAKVVRLDVTTSDGDEFARRLGLAGLVPGKAIEAPPSMAVTIESVSPRLGMTGGEVLISVAISIGTGLPTNLLASWIWAKLSARGENPIAVPGSDREANSESEVGALAETLNRDVEKR